MSLIATLIHCFRVATASAALLTMACISNSQAAIVTVSLDAVADPTSNFNAYWSEGLVQLNMPFPGTTRQPFWDTKDLSRTYNNSFDFFPNEAAMRFGHLTYDNASLVGGSGIAAVTGLTLGIERDPLNSNYVNGSWLSFTTDLQTYSGSVTVSNGAVTGIDLTASYSSLGYFGLTPVNGSGTFSVSGSTFQVLASATNPGFGNYNPSMAWNWSGVISSVATAPPTIAADFDGNGFVDASDLAKWKIGMGIASGAAKNQGDANSDGAVDGTDFLIWQREFGMGTPPTLAAVPEPNAALLLVTAFAGLSFRRCGQLRYIRRRSLGMQHFQDQ